MPESKASPDAAAPGIAGQLRTLLRALGASPQRRRIALLSAGIVIVIVANMVGQVRLNAWKGDFFDALEQRALYAFLMQVGVFLLIIAGLLALVVAETWLREILEVRAREWLTHDLLDQWLAPKRAHFLAFAGEIGVNPDQRMQADALRLTELSVGLSIGLLRSALLLLSFLGVLWVLSADIQFVVQGSAFSVPGYLVWCALAYAISGSWLTWRVGRPLIGINAERYAREAELRFALVRISESAESISLYGGESDERRALAKPVERVVDITRRLANAVARLTWITSGYGWLALLVPVLAAAPGYFQGALTFGGLMMTVGAFNQVQAALRWFVDNFPRIADWRATLLRVTAFRDTLPTLEALGAEAGRIEFRDDAGPRIVLDKLTLALPDGRFALSQERVELAAGERVLVASERSPGRSTLLRALAGLWPWGSGTICLPPRDALMFVPQRPYLPLGTLRGAATYPAAPDAFPSDGVSAALCRVDLDHLVPLLDREERWDKELSIEEQQRLAFARVLLHAPQAVFLVDDMGALDGHFGDLILSIFGGELAGTNVVAIGGGNLRDGFYHRVLHLVPVPGAPGLDLQRLQRLEVSAARPPAERKTDPSQVLGVRGLIASAAALALRRRTIDDAPA